jgi:translation initiation factor IF-2
MAEVTVSEFAQLLKVPVERLLVQLDEAGIKVSGAEDKISEDAKLELLTHLRKSHGRKDPAASAPRRITLRRKSQTELKLAGGQGRARTVNVEVRQKRTYIKRDVLEEQARKQQEELEAQKQAEENKRLEAERLERERLEAEQRAREDEERRLVEEREREEQERAEQEQKLQAEQSADQEEQRKATVEKDVAAAAESARKEKEAREARERFEADRARQAAKRGKAGAAPESRDNTLHVADGMAGRRRKKRPRRRSVQVSVDTQHGFERPTAPVVREVEIPETISVG